MSTVSPVWRCWHYLFSICYQASFILVFLAAAALVLRPFLSYSALFDILSISVYLRSFDRRQLLIKTYNLHIDHPWSVVVYNFGSMCMSVCVSYCRTITFERVDIGSSFSNMRYISREYRSSSYMEVIGSRLRLQEQKRSKIPIPVKLRSAITPVL